MLRVFDIEPSAARNTATIRLAEWVVGHHHRMRVAAAVRACVTEDTSGRGATLRVNLNCGVSSQ